MMSELAKIHDIANRLARRAEKAGFIIRAWVCEACQRYRFLVRHHRDYGKPLAITWICRPCHGQEHFKHKMKESEIETAKEYRRIMYRLYEKLITVSGPGASSASGPSILMAELV